MCICAPTRAPKQTGLLQVLISLQCSDTQLRGHNCRCCVLGNWVRIANVLLNIILCCFFPCQLQQLPFKQATLPLLSKESAHYFHYIHYFSVVHRLMSWILYKSTITAKSNSNQAFNKICCRNWICWCLMFTSVCSLQEAELTSLFTFSSTRERCKHTATPPVRLQSHTSLKTRLPVGLYNLSTSPTSAHSSIISYLHEYSH